MIVTRTSDILVVDDSPLLRSVLLEMLRECGFSVRTASDGFTALATMRDRLPDVLLSDLQMPGMSGFELLSIVRHRFPSVAAVAMSGAYAGADIPSGVAADAFYPKGACSFDRLIEIVTCLTECGDLRRPSEMVTVPTPMISHNSSKHLIGRTPCWSDTRPGAAR
jgi:CheY-like chemotaxis protein